MDSLLQNRHLLYWLMGLLPLVGLLALVNRALPDPVPNSDWSEYNGNAARDHYSLLNQITAQNVTRLSVAWAYTSGGADTVQNRTQIQCNPLIINGILYGVSADTQAFALDAATGKQRWRTHLTDTGGTTSRGVTYWADETGGRLFFGAGPWLYALDVATGERITSFGENGRINLKTGLERPGADNYVVSNTPNTTYKNLLIVGVRVAESETALLGDIRAYDVRSGRLIWTFHTIPKAGEAGYSTWAPQPARQHIGGANAWAGMAIDRKRGIVYIPTGSAAYDFYGGNRKGNNLFANCLLALDATTGKRLWHYQLVHHDIWDRDPPAPPTLLTVTHRGQRVDAVSQITKQGHIFVFDRVTGKPLFPIDEQPFPGSTIPEEQTSPTQPIPRLPQSFSRQQFTVADFNPWVANRDSLIGVLGRAQTGGPYRPVTTQMTIFFPGTDGGGQWGGAAADPQGILYVPSKEIPVYTSLVKRENLADRSMVTGEQLYQQQCSACHGTDRRGSHDGSYPSLIDLAKRATPKQVETLLLTGRGLMPSFSHLSAPERQVLIRYTLTLNTDNQVVTNPNQPTAVPYQHTGYNRWYDRNGYPVNTPPWGTLTATDLNTGKRRWQVPLGEYAELTAKGIPATGTDNYGGPLVTKSDLLFIAASRDAHLRAFDTRTGRLLWQHTLPAAGYASPSTYSVNGRQYIVIACGGGKLKTKSGDQYVAFALPE